MRAICVSLLIAATSAEHAFAQVAPPAGMQRAEVATRTTTGRVNGSRLAKYTVLGAGTGAGLAMGYWAMSEKGQRGGNCQPIDCALPYLTISGALAGLFLARELEAQRIAVTPREGTLTRYALSEAALLSPPAWADGNDSLLVVATDSGVQVLATRNASRLAPSAPRAAGLRAIRQVALVPERNMLSIGTATALWETPLTAGPARRIADGAITAIASHGRSVLSASGTTVRLQRVTTDDVAITDSVSLGSAVQAVAWDTRANQWWAATDSSLVPLTQSASALNAGSALPIPAGARRIAVGTNYIAVAVGDAGVVVYPRSALGTGSSGGVITPLRLQGEPRFAFDADFLGDTLFVAGGVDGLFRVEVGPNMRVIDASRQFPFATLVRNQNGVLWVGDRARQQMVRIER